MISVFYLEAGAIAAVAANADRLRHESASLFLFDGEADTAENQNSQSACERRSLESSIGCYFLEE